MTLATSAHPHRPLGSEAEGPPRRGGDTGRIHHQHGPRAAGAIRGDPSLGASPASPGLRTGDPLLRSGPGPAPFKPASASLAGPVKAGAFIPAQGVCIPVPIVPCLPGDTESLGFSWRRSGETQSGLASPSLQIKCLFKDASPDVAAARPLPRQQPEATTAPAAGSPRHEQERKLPSEGRAFVRTHNFLFTLQKGKLACFHY